MKAKQIYLTGILALIMVIGASAHDKGATTEDAASMSEKYEIELPRVSVEPDVTQAIDLSHFNQATMKAQLRELSMLVSVKHDDLLITESASSHSDCTSTASIDALVKQQQTEAQLTNWKSTDAAITEMGR